MTRDQKQALIAVATKKGVRCGAVLNGLLNAGVSIPSGKHPADVLRDLQQTPFHWPSVHGSHAADADVEDACAKLLAGTLTTGLKDGPRRP